MPSINACQKEVYVRCSRGSKCAPTKISLTSIFAIKQSLLKILTLFRMGLFWGLLTDGRRQKGKTFSES